MNVIANNDSYKAAYRMNDSNEVNEEGGKR